MSSTPIDSTSAPGGMREALESAARNACGGARGVSDWVNTSDSKHSRRTFSPDVFNILELYVIFCQIETKFEKKMEEEFAKAQF